ncbi:hypothetical protein ABZ404_37150 [Streptomyces sp. NPDC005878]|uniref:hypothetical protein n=1 Tax=Streptomyces sp. NPDC005878 TaxID=3157077 RepID=UPI0033CB1423
MERATTTAPEETADRAWDHGYADGSKAATDGVTEDVARDRAESAEHFRPLYAAGFWEGYLSTVASQAALHENTRDTA